MEKPISQGNAALPLSGISSADGGPEAGGLRGAVANNHGNDKQVQACTAPTPWLGFVFALLLVVGASLAYLYFKP